MKIEDLQSTLEAREMKVVESETKIHDEQELLVKFKKLEASKEVWKNNKGKKSNNGEETSETSSNNGGGPIKNHRKKKTFDKRKVQCYNCEKMRHYANEFC